MPAAGTLFARLVDGVVAETSSGPGGRDLNRRFWLMSADAQAAYEADPKVVLEYAHIYHLHAAMVCLPFREEPAMSTLTEMAQAQEDKEAASEQAELRIEFAKAALTGFCANPKADTWEPEAIAIDVWEQADEMMKAMRAGGK
jgi:hypothetical protein